MWAQLRRWLERNEAVILLVIFSVILRVPSWFEPYWYGDEGIYLTLGGAIKKGLTLYRDIHDNKPPLLYFLAAAAGTVFYFRLLLTVWFAAAVAVFYRLVKKMLPQQPRAWTLATGLMIVLTTMFEGNIANAEIFIVLPVGLGMLLALRSKPAWGWIGLLFSAGFLLKVPAAFDLVALAIWLVFWRKTGLKNLLRLGLGFTLPIAATILYYWWRGGLEPYVRSALLQNLGYLASWSTGEHSASGFTSQAGLLARFAAGAGFSLALYFVSRRFKISSAAVLALIWFVWALFGALLSERPYPHYLIQPALPLTLLISFFIFGRRRLLRLITLVIFLSGGYFYYQIRFWQYPVISYYTNWLTYALGQKSAADYLTYFDPRVNQTYRLAEYIRSTTGEDEPIFIWGDEPYVYALSQRLPVGRYTVAYHIVDFNGWEETIAAVDSSQPKIIAVMTYESRNFDRLNARLTTDYVLAATIDRANVYRRLPPTNL